MKTRNDYDLIVLTRQLLEKKMQEILGYIQSYLVKKIEIEFLKEKNKQPKPTEKALEKKLQELKHEYQIDNWLNICKASFEKMNEIGLLKEDVAKKLLDN